MTIAELIRRRRDERGLNDERAADQLGISQPTFSRWRSGRSVPDVDRITDLAAWLDVSEDVVALAIVEGKRNRPPADRANAWLEVLGQLEEMHARLDEVERRVGPATDTPD